MGLKWESKGCRECRRLWETGRHPPELAVSYSLHSRLHRCEVCGAYWEQLERYADIIDAPEARRLYPDAFRATE
jgi:hypothetical protein